MLCLAQPVIEVDVICGPVQPGMVLALCWQQPQQGCPGCIRLSLGYVRTTCSSCTLQMLTQAEAKAAQLWVQPQGNTWARKQSCLLLQEPCSQLRQILLPPFPWLSYSCSMPLVHPQLESCRGAMGAVYLSEDSSGWAGAAGAQTLEASRLALPAQPVMTPQNAAVKGL